VTGNKTIEIMDICEKYEILDSIGKGKGLFAREKINVGDEILTEKPLVSTLTNAKCRGVRCDFCFAEPEKLLKCSICKFVYYCGKKCQLEDWSMHKRECKCLKKVMPKQPPDLCRLLSHLLFKYYWKSNTLNREEVEGLSGDKTRISNARKEAFFTFGAVLFEYLEECPIDLEEADILSLLCKISCNSFTVTNAELNTIGTGIYKVGSYLNHSCDPNACAVFSGNVISIRAMKTIVPGEEILISYTDLMQPSAVRKSELLEGYMFDCTCAHCDGDPMRDMLFSATLCKDCQYTILPVKVENDIGIKLCKCIRDEKDMDTRQKQKASELCDELDHLYTEIKIVPSSEQQNKLEGILKRAKTYLSPVNLSVVHACEVSMDGCLEREEWKQALMFSKMLETAYKVYLTEYHPSLGIHYFKQGKLQFLQDDVRDGVESLQKANKILTATHGAQHTLVEQLRQSLAESTREMVERDRWSTVERIYHEG